MSRPLTISIAMCTYNGEQFLQEQLDSFLEQTRLPDELVVCDDGSTDSTISILEAFVVKAPFPVRVFINPQNLGFNKNFEKAISLCQGEIISISDQDDVWLKNKLMNFERMFLTYPEAGLIFCNASVVDDNLQSLDYSMWDLYGFPSDLKKYFEPGEFTSILFKRGAISGICGAMTAIKANLRSFIIPFPKHWIYDHWILLSVSLLSGICPIHKSFNLYRQHFYQAIGINKDKLRLMDRLNILLKNQRIDFEKQLDKWIEALYRLSSDDYFSRNTKFISLIKDKIIHLKVRYKMPRQRLRRFPLVLKEAFTGRYGRYSKGYRSIIKDIICS